MATQTNNKYRLTSMEEPTDEMLHALMEDVAGGSSHIKCQG